MSKETFKSAGETPERTGLSEEEKARFLLAKTDETVRNELVLENQGLVGKVVSKFYTTGSISKEDLFQEGAIALMKAIVNFEPGKGDTFSTYAFDCIKKSLKTALRKNSGRTVSVPQYAVRADFKRSSTINANAKKNNITKSESAEQLGLSEVSILPQEKSMSEELKNDSDLTIGDTIADEKVFHPETTEMAKAEIEKLFILIIHVVDGLQTQEERNVFFARYGNSLSQPYQKLPGAPAIGETLHMSKEKVKDTLDIFWRKTKHDLEIDENAFLNILKRRYELQEHVNAN
jgi:RNA polymerase sigma factor (sigma-70 family)